MDKIKFIPIQEGIDIEINGEVKTIIEYGHIKSSVLNPSSPITNELMLEYQEFNDARVFRSSFCIEDCCASTWIRIKETSNTYIFHTEHCADYPITRKQNYEFDKIEYLKEVNRFLIELDEYNWKEHWNKKS